MTTIRDLINLVEDQQQIDWKEALEKAMYSRGLPLGVMLPTRVRNIFEFYIDFEDASCGEGMHNMIVGIYTDVDTRLVSPGPDIYPDLLPLQGWDEDEVELPVYSNKEELEWTIEEYCLSMQWRDDIQYISSSGNLVNKGFLYAYSDEEWTALEDPSEVFERIVNSYGVGIDGAFDFVMSDAWIENPGKIDYIGGVESSTNDREVFAQPGECYVDWADFALHFKKENGKIVVATRGWGYDPQTKKMAPAEKSPQHYADQLYDHPWIKKDLEQRTDTSKRFARKQIQDYAKWFAQDENTGLELTDRQVGSVLTSMSNYPKTMEE